MDVDLISPDVDALDQGGEDGALAYCPYCPKEADFVMRSSSSMTCA
jgi:hypothetical protein